MRLSHRVQVAAPVPAVWALLADARRWPETEAALRRVEGSQAPLTAGQHLVAVVRGSGLRIPVDVTDVVPERLVAVVVHLAPGLHEERTIELVRTVSGGTTLRLSSSCRGSFAAAGALPTWFAGILSLRRLAHRASRDYRAGARTSGAA